MIFPIGDDNSDRTTVPVVNYILIAINVLVFIFLQSLGTNEQFTYAFSTVPEEIRTGVDIARPVPIEIGDQRGEIGLQPTPVSVYLTLLTSMFMHGSIMHLFGNMLFLWIFGDNLEHALGRATFVFGDNPFIPSLGASGAISGVLGGYLVLYPKRKVRVIMLRMLTTVPAVVAIGLWFVFQLISAFGVIGAGPQSGGGVAFMAHIGGFVAGVALVKVFSIGRNPNAIM